MRGFVLGVLLISLPACAGFDFGAAGSKVEGLIETLCEDPQTDKVQEYCESRDDEQV